MEMADISKYSGFRYGNLMFDYIRKYKYIILSYINVAESLKEYI